MMAIRPSASRVAVPPVPGTLSDATSASSSAPGSQRLICVHVVVVVVHHQVARVDGMPSVRSVIGKMLAALAMGRPVMVSVVASNRAAERTESSGSCLAARPMWPPASALLLGDKLNADITAVHLPPDQVAPDRRPARKI